MKRRRILLKMTLTYKARRDVPSRVPATLEAESPEFIKTNKKTVLTINYKMTSLKGKEEGWI